MPRSTIRGCLACAHVRRPELDARLASDAANVRDVAAEFGISVRILARHFGTHDLIGAPSLRLARLSTPHERH